MFDLYKNLEENIVLFLSFIFSVINELNILLESLVCVTFSIFLSLFSVGMEENSPSLLQKRSWILVRSINKEFLKSYSGIIRIAEMVGIILNTLDIYASSLRGGVGELPCKTFRKIELNP